MSASGNNKYISSMCYVQGAMLDIKELSTSISDHNFMVGKTYWKNMQLIPTQTE